MQRAGLPQAQRRPRCNRVAGDRVEQRAGVIAQRQPADDRPGEPRRAAVQQGDTGRPWRPGARGELVGAVVGGLLAEQLGQVSAAGFKLLYGASRAGTKWTPSTRE